MEQPPELGHYPVKNYEYAGDGEVVQEEVANDDAKVAANIKKAPDVSKFEVDGWTVKWYVIKKESDGWHVDGIRVKKETPEASTGPAVTATPVVTDPAVTATPVVTEPAVTATPVVTDPAVTAAPGNTYIPLGPVGPQQTSGVSGETNTKVSPTPTDNVKITEDEIPNGAPVATESTEPVESNIPAESAEPAESSNPSESTKPAESNAPTASPVATPAPTATPDATEDMPFSPSSSDEEPEPVEDETATETPAPVELGQDDIASSDVVDSDDDETDSTTEKKAKKVKTSADTKELDDEDIPNSGASALPQTGVTSENVFYIFGSMICALGISIGVFSRKKQKK